MSEVTDRWAEATCRHMTEVCSALRTTRADLPTRQAMQWAAVRSWLGGVDVGMDGNDHILAEAVRAVLEAVTDSDNDLR